MSSISHALLKDNATTSDEIGLLSLPPLKTGTLESLITLSEDLPKQDTIFTGVVAKIVDTLRNLLNNDADALSQHIQVNEKAIDDYILGWGWNGQKYRTDRSLREIVETLGKVCVCGFGGCFLVFARARAATCEILGLTGWWAL